MSKKITEKPLSLKDQIVFGLLILGLYLNFIYMVSRDFQLLADPIINFILTFLIIIGLFIIFLVITENWHKIPKFSIKIEKKEKL